MDNSISHATIVSFEGTDGAFKETNAKALMKHLKEKGKSVYLFSFPNYDSNSSYFVKEYLKGKYGDLKDIKPEVSSIFYAIDRYDTFIKEIKDIYYNSPESIIIFDRYCLSNAFFQCSKFQDPENHLKDILSIDYELFGLPKEDIIFYLTINPEINEKILQSRSASDIHEKNHEYQIEVYNKSQTIINAYEKLYDNKINIVDCYDNYNDRFLSREEIINVIIDYYNISINNLKTK